MRRNEMSLLMAKKPAAKKDGTDTPERKRNTAPVQIEKELARMAATIASHDGVTQSELLSPVVRQFLIMNYERVKRQIQENLNRMNAENK